MDANREGKRPSRVPSSSSFERLSEVDERVDDSMTRDRQARITASPTRHGWESRYILYTSSRGDAKAGRLHDFTSITLLP
jgi:hypothetical protein